MTSLVAGRELDAMIAERVMGWSGRSLVRKRGNVGYEIAFKQTSERWSMGEYSVWYTEDGTKLYCGTPWAPNFAPHYSDDIASAFLIVEAMRARGWWVDLVGRNGEGMSSWTAWFYEAYSVGRDEDCAAATDTLPLAICLAALAALDAHSSEKAQLESQSSPSDQEEG